MIIHILIAILIGICIGILTGLAPGIHINLVSAIILALSPFLLQFTTPLILAVVIISIAITHTFLDAIPSIYLGAPDDSMALSVLPGHRLLLQGLGYEAVALTVIGSLLAVIISVALTPVIIPTIKFIYPLIKDYIGYILIFASLILIIKERKSKIWAFFIFMLAGILGIATLNLPLSQPLFPLLSGLFGTSILLVSLLQKSKIPPQRITHPDISKKDIAKSMSSGLIASCLCGFLPGLGSAQAAILATSFFKKITAKSFLVLVGSINTIITILSFIAIYSIDKARSGAVVIISKLIGEFNLNYLILFLIVCLIVAGIASILTLKVAKIFSSIFTKINYQKTCLAIILLITILAIVLTGPLGLFVLVISTSIGVIPSLVGIGKNHLMGCLLLPVILFFLL